VGDHQKRALVTGGAGLIGSHIVDLLLSEGWTVRILDNLEPNTHKFGKPAWINPAAEFVQGEVQDYTTMLAALQDIDIVFHEAAYGGYMPEIAKYVLVNSFGTAQLLEIIRDHNLPVKKVIVASSQAVYSEGAAQCPEHGFVEPAIRPVDQLRAGDFSVHCPHISNGRICGKPTTSIPTPESMPMGGETVYGLTKVDQEKLVLLWGKQTGIPTVALRYSTTFHRSCTKMETRRATCASWKTSRAPTCLSQRQTSWMACRSTPAAATPPACATWRASSRRSSGWGLSRWRAASFAPARYAR
jgi:dTDP-L-rhamnose 4-epimerase